MLIAGRNGMAVKFPVTARNYVQNSLIAMWDGIENAGYGVHDSNATVWKDLVGDRDFLNLTSSNGITIDNDSVVKNSGKLGCVNSIITSPNFQTLEVLFSASSGARSILVSSSRNNRFAIISHDGSYVQFSSTKAIVKSSGYFTSSNVIHIACTFESDLPTTAFLDGYTTPLGTISNSWNQIYGLCIMGWQSANSFAYRGKIFSVRLYSRALTAAEVSANYAVDKARFGL